MSLIPREIRAPLDKAVRILTASATAGANVALGVDQQDSLTAAELRAHRAEQRATMAEKVADELGEQLATHAAALAQAEQELADPGEVSVTFGPETPAQLVDHVIHWRTKAKTLGRDYGRASATIHSVRCENALLRQELAKRSEDGLRYADDVDQLVTGWEKAEAATRRLRERIAELALSYEKEAGKSRERAVAAKTGEAVTEHNAEAAVYSQAMRELRALLDDGPKLNGHRVKLLPDVPLRVWERTPTQPPPAVSIQTIQLGQSAGMCCDKAPTGYLCTEPLGHDGMHCAATDGEVHATWDADR